LESLDNDFPSLDLTGKDSEPAKIEYLVKNTFIDGHTDYPALRSWSLEEFLLERRTKSAPNTAPNSGVMQRLESLEEEPSVEPDRYPATPDLSQCGTILENLEYLEEEQEESPPEDDAFGMVRFPASAMPFPTKPNEFHGLIQQHQEFHGLMQQQQDEVFAMPMCNMTLFSDRSTMAPSDVDPTLHDMTHMRSHSGERFDGSFPLEQQENQPIVVVELDSVLDKWSVGSSGHHFGRCKPCAFFWKTGCKDGQACQFCHTCPLDEKKKRTKQKQAWRRAVKATRATLRYGLF